MVLRLGIAMIAVGGIAKGMISTYRAVKGKKVFDSSKMAKDYYKGGFQSNMTRREAQLILNVRETTPVQKIRESHRKMMLINHPDNQGSTYVAIKINEAKELLLKN